MKKILYVVSSLKKTGPNIQLYYILQNLDRKVFEPYIMSLKPTNIESMIEDIKMLNIPVKEVVVDKFGFNYKKVKKEIELFGPDVIHTSGIRPDRIASKLKLGIPTVCTIHNYMYDDYRMRYGNVLGKLMVWNHMKYLKKIDCPIVVSKSIKKLYSENFKKDFEVIQNGVDINKYHPVNIERKRELRQKLGIPTNKLVYISTGHHSAIKNPEMILNGFLNHEYVESTHLIFLGEGELTQKIKKIANDASNVQFTGRVNNVEDFLKASDIFVTASHTEGLPNALLEAMSCNLGVIASSISPHREVLDNQSITKQLFSVASIEELVESFNSITKKYANSNNSNRKNIEEKFSSQIMTLKYQELYNRFEDSI